MSAAMALRSVAGALPRTGVVSLIGAAAPLLPSFRSIHASTTDGPFRHLKARITYKKKHYNQVLVMADRRKLLEVAQDLLNDPTQQFKRQFWEIMSKRCIQSMHLLRPIEVAIIARAFDTHDVQIRGRDVFGAAAPYIRASKEVPGHAVIIFADIFSRRLRAPKEEVKDVLMHLSRRATEVMWEIAPRHGVSLLTSLAAFGIQDTSLASRVSRKLLMHLEFRGEDVLDPVELAAAAEALAAQNHRDLDLLNGLAEYVVEYCERNSDGAAHAASRILACFEALEVDVVPEALQRVAAAVPA